MMYLKKKIIINDLWESYNQQSTKFSGDRKLQFPDRLFEYSTSFDDHEAPDDQCNFDHQNNTNFRVKAILEEFESANTVPE